MQAVQFVERCSKRDFAWLAIFGDLQAVFAGLALIFTFGAAAEVPPPWAYGFKEPMPPAAKPATVAAPP